MFVSHHTVAIVDLSLVLLCSLRIITKTSQPPLSPPPPLPHPCNAVVGHMSISNDSGITMSHKHRHANCQWWCEQHGSQV